MKSHRYLFFTILLVVISISCFAAGAGPPPTNPPGSGMGPPCWPPPCIPIDGGVTFLAAAAIAYGGKKLYDFKKKA